MDMKETVLKPQMLKNQSQRFSPNNLIHCIFKVAVSTILKINILFSTINQRVYCLWNRYVFGLRANLGQLRSYFYLLIRGHTERV